MWSEYGNLCLYDKKAKIRQPLKFVALPIGFTQTDHVRSGESSNLSVSAMEAFHFEVASMKLIGEENNKEEVTKIPQQYQDILDRYPNILEPSFQDLSTKHGVTHKIPTGDATPIKA